MKPSKMAMGFLFLLFAAAVMSPIALAGCGDDDDGVTHDPDSPWFTTITPSGVKVECINIAGWGWCREVPG